MFTGQMSPSPGPGVGIKLLPGVGWPRVPGWPNEAPSTSTIKRFKIKGQVKGAKLDQISPSWTRLWSKMMVTFILMCADIDMGRM